ncbi:MAG TPA: RNA polymerase sigma factor [Acidimicrobiia bacterium]|nr:RNA polymerase sigma factor [Acidimicrobiia bacterium]
MHPDSKHRAGDVASVTDIDGARRRRSVEGSDSSFSHEIERLYRVDGNRLWRAVYAYSGSRVVADDATAEAFAQLIRRGRAVENARAWVWRSAFRIAGGLLKDRHRTVNELVIDLSYEEPPDVIDLVRLLQELSSAQRASIVLHDYAGYRAREAAEIIGSTEAAVRVHLMRGRRKLRERLDSAD